MGWRSIGCLSRSPMGRYLPRKMEARCSIHHSILRILGGQAISLYYLVIHSRVFMLDMDIKVIVNLYSFPKNPLMFNSKEMNKMKNLNLIP